jgi:hypothetical protein
VKDTIADYNQRELKQLMSNDALPKKTKVELKTTLTANIFFGTLDKLPENLMNTEQVVPPTHASSSVSERWRNCISLPVHTIVMEVGIENRYTDWQKVLIGSTFSTPSSRCGDTGRFWIYKLLF